MIKRATMEDTDVLYDIIDTKKFPGAIRDMVHRLRSPLVYVFLSEDKEALMIFEPCYGIVPWVNGHVYSKESIRGPRLMEFYLECGLYIADHTDYEVITVVVPEWLGLRHSLWMSHVGFTKRWDILGNMMFTADMSQVDKFRDHLKKLKETLEPKKPKGE